MVGSWMVGKSSTGQNPPPPTNDQLFPLPKHGTEIFGLATVTESRILWRIPTGEYGQIRGRGGGVGNQWVNSLIVQKCYDLWLIHVPAEHGETDPKTGPLQIYPEIETTRFWWARGFRPVRASNFSQPYQKVNRFLTTAGWSRLPRLGPEGDVTSPNSIIYYLVG